MKNILQFFVVLLMSFSNLFAQDNYRKDHVIVYFHDDVLDKNLLTSDSRSFNKSSLILSKSLRDSLDKWNTGSTLQKVIRHARPDRLISISRTGEDVTIPKFYNLMYVAVPENEDALAFCKKLETLPFVIYAEPDYIMKINDAPAPNDTHFNLQRGWEQTNDRDIDLLRAWDFTRGSNVVRVGVMDTGIDYHNPDLGNGSFGAGNKVAGGFDYEDNDSNPDDTGNSSSHGTAVAGIIGAQANNVSGVAGIAGGDALIGNIGVQLIALRVGEDGFAIGNVVEAIYDATTSLNQGGFGCHLLNYSGGGYTIYNSVRKAISYAAHNGVIFVAAKGNDDTTNKHYPSDYADNLVISVGASNGLDERASFSNYGNNVDFVAPGTTDLLFTTKRVEQDTYGTFSGTSGAAPVVTGIAALLKSANINLHRDDIENILQIAADKVGSIPYTNGYNEQMGNGRVNAGRALEFLQAPYILQQHTTTGGTSQNLSGDGEGLTFLNDAGNSGLAEGWYYGQMYQVTKTVNIPVSICNESYVWTRTVGATTGWSAANPNNNLGYAHIVSQTSTTVTLRTYVYYIKRNSINQTINAWYPTSPQNAVMAYTTLTHSPITISGPTTVCTSNNTFNLNNIQSGTSITWNVSSNLQIVSGQGTTSAIVKQSSYYNYGAGWVTATINACGTMVTLPNYQVWVGIPNSPGSVIGSTSPNIGSTQYYYATSSASGASSHTWTLPYENGSCTYCWSIYSQGTPTAIYANVGEASGYVQIAGNNVCGTGGASILYVTPTGSGGCDPCQRKRSEPTDSEVDEVSLEKDISEAIIAYPNPSPNTFTIQLNKDIELTKSLHVFIYDTSGRLIKSYEIDERKFMIDLNANPKGLYFLKTTVPNKNLNLKLQKE